MKQLMGASFLSAAENRSITRTFGPPAHQPPPLAAPTFRRVSTAAVNPDARVLVWARVPPLGGGRSGVAVVHGPWLRGRKSFETGRSGLVLGCFWLPGYPESRCLFVWLLMELSTHTSSRRYLYPILGAPGARAPGTEIF